MSIHPPKIETFDVAEGTNTDPKGFVREVESYRETADGLYVSRPMIDHPTLSYLRSWLLPGLGLRVTDFAWRPGHEKLQDFYLDVVDIRRDNDRWFTEDHYLDLVVRTGTSTDVLDADEFCAAVATGLLPPETAERALTTTHRTLDGLASHDHDLDRWLDTQGVRLAWE